MLKWISKRLSSMRHAPQAAELSPLLRRTRFDYRKEVGGGFDASVVTAPVHWLQRALPEARLKVTRTRPNGDVEEVADHKALTLIRRPNPYYGDIALWAATIWSWCLDGNAYWLKQRDGFTLPKELWYVPHWMMKPVGSRDGTEFLSHYRYSPGGGIAPMNLDPADVVHFRHGLDPRDPRRGISPLDGVIREIFMDLESSNFVASLLRNMGVPGVVISPKGGGLVPADDVAATKAWFQEQFGGDRRGAPLVMGAPTDVTPYGFNPQQMNMSEARDVAEERVCACLGISPAVVGFGAGLQSTKVGATMTELRKLAWHNGVLPMGRAFADELDRSLLPDFGGQEELEAGWKTDDVPAMQDDLNQAATRWNTMIQGGWAQVAEGREAMGMEVDDSHRIYLRPAMALETPAAPARRKAGRQVPEEKARATREQRLAARGYVMAMQRQEEPLNRAMEKRLLRFFNSLGKAAHDVALPLLQYQDGAPKAVKSDDLLVAQVLERLGIASHRTAFQKLYEAHFIDVARKVAEAAELAGLGGSLPDPVARSIAGAGGRRAGLVDLDKQSRAALFDAIAEGRAAGEGAQQLADRIAAHIEGGPWSTPEIRARTIARTETKYAQNVSTIERARAGGVERFIVFDGRLGPGRSLDSHIARDGSIVSAAEAAQMAADEHPNGTLSFAPHFGDDDKED